MPANRPSFPEIPCSFPRGRSQAAARQAAQPSLKCTESFRLPHRRRALLFTVSERGSRVWTWGPWQDETLPVRGRPVARQGLQWSARCWHSCCFR
ncbi:hypothetical protein DB31_6385 [Hyalangium minutum]|uniref:Uncharacterized protein n=1 Tax=Hyalangium minutum TaxID=394096 RepID=A0A085WNZ7_9BACT|nr:hypothetical protein DB31_6385 [Hyalangium minutum]